METALIILGCSGVTLAFLAGVFRIEDARRGRLLFLSTTRVKVSHWLERFVISWRQSVRYVRQRMYRFFRHYVMQVVLVSWFQALRSSEQKVERYLRSQTLHERRREGEREKNHLDFIAEHKTDVALSDAQKQRIKAHH